MSQMLDDVEEFLDSFLIERGGSEHTVDAYRRDLTRSAAFFDQLGYQGWRDLDSDALLRHEIALGASQSKPAALRASSALRSLLKWLMRRNRGPEVDLPSSGVSNRPKWLLKALTPEEVTRLTAAPETATPIGLRDRAALELLYGTGMRVSELCELQTQALSLDTAMVRPTGKRQKTRAVPLPRFTIPWLERYLESGRPKLEKRPSSYVFLGARGGPLSRKVVYEFVSRYARLADIDRKVGPHSLRHSYAVHLIQRGADLRSVQELLGHESVSTTQHYSHLDTAELERKYRRAHPRR